MALQRLGDVDMEALIGEMRVWAEGTVLEQRAAAAAMCEPRLLRQAAHARAVLQILDRITASIERADNRRSEEFLPCGKGWAIAGAWRSWRCRPRVRRSWSSGW